LGLPGLILLLIAAAVLAYPFSRILPRVGLNPWWSIFAIVPVFAIVLLWVVALKDWEDR
jgi:hypothetical protein